MLENCRRIYEFEKKANNFVSVVECCLFLHTEKLVFLCIWNHFTVDGYHSRQASVHYYVRGRLGRAPPQLTNCFWRRLAQNSKSKRPSGGSPMQSNTASAITKSSSDVYLFNTRTQRSTYKEMHLFRKDNRDKKADKKAKSWTGK
jgi:hypothetical protein